ncbi:MAG TPA: aminotransferase class IV, partial [Steroidobacteraceae bacterium]
ARAAVLEVAPALGFDAVVADVSVADVQRAEEVFLTNALIGVWPVRQIDERYLPLGRVTSELQSPIARA